MHLRWIFLSPIPSEPLEKVTRSLFLFWLLEFGVYAVLILTMLDKALERVTTTFAVTVVVLIWLPLFRYGYFNDLSLRASVPGLFILAILSLNALLDKSKPWIPRSALVITVAIGTIAPATHVIDDIIRFPGGPCTTEEGTLWSVHKKYEPWFPFIMQYVGDGNAWFFRHLSRPLRTPEAAPIREVPD